MREYTRTPHRFTVLALTVAAVLIAAACSGGESGSTDASSVVGSTATDTGATDPTSDTAAPGTEPTSAPTAGGTLTYIVESESPGGFCLAEAQLAAGGLQVANAIFEPLMAFDANLAPQPYLAERLDVSADATSFTFTLREGIVFHDGSPLDSSVVKDNFDLWRGDAAAIAQYGRKPLLTPFIFSDIATVTAPDANTVIITTKRPWPALPTHLATGRFGIMGRAQYGSPDCAEQLVGTGPFRLAEWQRGQFLRAERFADYWRTDAAGVQLPYLDEVVFKPTGGGQAGLQALSVGEADALHTSGQAILDEIAADPEQFQLIAEDEGHKEVGYIMLNSSRAPLDDLEVRRHLTMAIDTELLTDIVSDGGFGYAASAFDTNVLGHLDDVGGPGYDPDQAADFFADKSITLSLSYATDPATKLISESVKTQLEDVGVNVEISEMDQATLINQAIFGDYDMVWWRNHAGADPDTQYVWWRSGSPANFGRINDPVVDEMLDSGRVEQDPEQRQVIYESLNQALVDGAFNVWCWYTEWGIGTTLRAHNLTGTTLPDGSEGAGMNWGWHYLTEAWVDQ